MKDCQGQEEISEVQNRPAQYSYFYSVKIKDNVRIIKTFLLAE